MQIVINGSKGGNGKSTITLSLYHLLKSIGENVQIVDHDPQGTIQNLSLFTDIIEPPVSPKEANAKFIIHDTPPYNASSLLSLLKSSDIIIIPVKVSHADLLALKTVVENLRKEKITEKAFLVFNEVRKPHNSMYNTVKKYFDSNYKDIKRAKTELSNLVAFRGVFESKLSGKAFNQISALAKEIGILKGIKTP